MKILQAEKIDAPAILALQQLAYQREAQLNNDWLIPPLTQTRDELEAEFSNRHFLKAVEGGMLVGSVRASQHDDSCQIGRLIVHPDFQRQGIGTQLLVEIENVFATALRFELFTGAKSLGNIRLYQRLGYVIFRESCLVSGARLVFLEKKAAPKGGGV